MLMLIMIWVLEYALTCRRDALNPSRGRGMYTGLHRRVSEHKRSTRDQQCQNSGDICFGVGFNTFSYDCRKFEQKVMSVLRKRVQFIFKMFSSVIDRRKQLCNSC
eukprot:378627_1